jgi:NAD(P)-dependent dehydrogenase (short-subunit alcohol dehydrogenase family)
MSKVWLIADATSVAGQALAETALAAGGHIVAGANQPARLAALAARHRGRVRAVPLDLTVEATVYAAINTALSAFGRLDIVVDTSAEAEVPALEESDDAVLRKRFERNFFGVVGLAHAALPVLREQGAGRIVHVASSDRGADAPRRAANAAVRGYFEMLAREVSAQGIEVVVIDTHEVPGEEFGVWVEDAPPKTRERGESAPRSRVVRFPTRSAA